MEERYNIPSSTPPCARYEGGEDDDRVTRVWIYVAGLVGGGANARELSGQIARLYDYKGSLIVAVRDGLPPDVEAFFRCAWEEIGHEPGELVEFLDVNSSEWQMYWGSRRFESDWQP
jgi:hypothetical protein